MRNNNAGSVAGLVVCGLLLLLFVSGCAATKNFLKSFAFWDRPKAPVELEAQRPETEQAVPEPPSLVSNKAWTVRGNPDAHYRLALYYQERGRHREAMEELEKTVIIDPGHYKAYNAMGVSCDYLAQFSKADLYYRKAMELAPKEVYLYNNLGYSLTLRGEYESAVAVLNRGVELNPSDDQIRNNLAMALAGAGRYDLAVAELNRTSDPGKALSALTGILEESGKADQAEILEARAASVSTPADPPHSRNRITSATPVASRQTKTPGARAAKKQGGPGKMRAPAAPGPGKTVTGVTMLRISAVSGTDLGPDFLKNKTAQAGEKETQAEKGKSAQDPIAAILRQPLPRSDTKERAIKDLMTTRLCLWL